MSKDQYNNTIVNSPVCDNIKTSDRGVGTEWIPLRYLALQLNFLSVRKSHFVLLWNPQEHSFEFPNRIYSFLHFSIFVCLLALSQNYYSVQGLLVPPDAIKACTHNTMTYCLSHTKEITPAVCMYISFDYSLNVVL